MSDIITPTMDGLLHELRAWALSEGAVVGVARVGEDVFVITDDPSLDRDDPRVRFASVDAARSICVSGGIEVVYDPTRRLRTLAIDAQPDPPERRVVRSACGRYERDVWFAPGRAAGDHTLAVFLDAEFYLHDMAALAAIREHFPSLSCAFVSFRDAASRHADYLCDPHYARFLADDVVASAAAYAARPYRDALLCGVSLSGLAAAHAVALCPHVFSAALAQSGSFWWLADHPVAFPETNARCWLSVGTEETETGVTHPPTNLLQRVSQIEGVERAAQLLRSRGATVHTNRYVGGHSFSAWRAEFAEALAWLLGADRS